MNCLARGCPPPAPGSRRCHCVSCHETFTGLTAFDRHQTLDGPGTLCHPPAHRGLIRREDGVWRLPGERPEVSFPASGDNENDLVGASAGVEASGGTEGAHDG